MQKTYSPFPARLNLLFCLFFCKSTTCFFCFCPIPVNFLSQSCCSDDQSACDSACLPRSDPLQFSDHWTAWDPLCIFPARFLNNWPLDLELWFLDLDGWMWIWCACEYFIHHKKRIFLLNAYIQRLDLFTGIKLLFESTETFLYQSSLSSAIW